MKPLLAALISFCALSEKPEDMQKYLSDTQTMVQQGKHEEALKRFLWFHEHALENDPAMSGVRLSFALSYWKSLGDVFPPANVAMIKVRDRTSKQVTDPGGNVRQFHDVVALNRTLDEDSKTCELFQTLDQTKPDLARQCWNVAKDPIIAAKQYDLVRKYIGNPVREYNRIKAMYDQNVALYDKPNIGGASFKAYNKTHFVEESLQLISVALALHDQKAAKEIQEKAQAVVDDPRLRDAISAPTTTDAQP